MQHSAISDMTLNKEEIEITGWILPPDVTFL